MSELNLGNTPEAAAAWVRAEIERSLPPGWRVIGLGRDPGLYGPGPLDGFIEVPRQHHTGYGVKISGGLDFVVFTWGNTDAGGGSLEQHMQRALVTTPGVLQIYGMAACIRNLITNYQPNEFGLT